MVNKDSITIKKSKIDSTLYHRKILYFRDDERYKRLDEEGQREKLNMFFDKYTVPYLEQQGINDPERQRERFLNKYLQPKKKEEPTDLSTSAEISPFGIMQPAEKKELEELPEVSIETKTKESEERKVEIDKFDSLEFEPPEIPGIYKAERSSIIQTTPDPTLLALREEQIKKQESSVKEAQAEIDKSDDFKYIKEKPDVFLNNIEGESKKIGRELRKKGYSKSVSREVISGIQQKANQDLLNSEKEKLFKYKSQEQVYKEAEELSQPYIDGWEEGSFINPQTGMRVKQPETDEEQDYLDYRNEVLLNLTTEAQVEISQADSILQANKDVPFVKRILQGDEGPVRINKEGKEESHLMAWGETDGKYFVYPTLTYKDGKWDEPKDPGKTALEEGNYIVLDSKEEAIKFAGGSWKEKEKEKDVKKLDIEKVKSLHLDAYIKKQYWDRRAEEVGAQFREETPTLGPVPRGILEFVRRKRSQANAEFEATSLMLHKNIGPKDIEKGSKFNWQIFGNAFAESLAGEVNMMDAKSIDREILTKINEIGSKEFKWTEEEEKHIEAMLLENVAEISGSLAPHMYNLIMLGQATNMLKVGTFVERLRKGYKILRNPVLKSSGKAWKIVVGADDAVPVGFKVLKTVNPSTWGKAQGLIYSSLIDEAVFTGVGGFQLGTMTGMNMAHNIRKINYKGKWGKILGPFIDMVVKSGFGATAGMEAGAITGMAVKSLMDQDVEFRRAWDDQWGDMSESGKRILAEIMVNTIAFGGMHLITNGTSKKLSSPIGEEMKWYGNFSPKYRMRVLDAAREAEKLGYTETSRQLYDWLDTSSSMLIGEEIRAGRIKEAQKIIEKVPDSHLDGTIKSYEKLINILEQKKKTKKFDGKTEWIEDGKLKEFVLKDRYELNLSLEEAYDKHGLYTVELAKRKTKAKEPQPIKMPELASYELAGKEITKEKAKEIIEKAEKIEDAEGLKIINDPELDKLITDKFKEYEKPKITPEAPEGEVTPPEIRKPGIPEEEVKPEAKKKELIEEDKKLTIEERVAKNSAKANLEEIKTKGFIRVADPVKISEKINKYTDTETVADIESGTVKIKDIEVAKTLEEAVSDLLKQREEEYEKVRKIEDLDERIKRATEVEEEYKEKITAQKAEGVYTGMDTTGPEIRTKAKAEIRKVKPEVLEVKPEEIYTADELIELDKIRPKVQGIGKGRFWEFRDEKGIFTVVPSKEEAVKRANEVLGKRSEIKAKKEIPEAKIETVEPEPGITVKVPTEKLSEREMDISMVDISTDPKRFQNREEAYSEETVKRIVEDYDPNKLDAIILWKDPKNGKTYILSGHSRMEAHDRLKKETIKAKYFEGTEKEAIEFGLDANVQATAESMVERAKRYRKLREEGKSEAEIKRQAEKSEGRNAERVIDYSHLDPNGRTVEILNLFEKTGEGENTENIRNVAQFIGRARRNWPGLTNAHETEMVDFMLNETNYKNFGTMAKFQELIETARGMFFKSEDPLNLAKIRERSYEELDYENKLKEYQDKFKTAKADLKKKKDELDAKYEKQQRFLKAGNKLHDFDVKLTMEKRAEILKPFEEMVEKTQGDIITFKEEEGKYKEASKQGISLWDQEMAELEKGREEARKRGDEMTEEELLKEIDKLTKETKEERASRVRENELGYNSLDPNQKTLDSKVTKEAMDKERKREVFLISDRVKDIMKKLGVPVGEKYLPKRLLGIYKHIPKKIRIQRIRDVFVATHEAAHFISHDVGIGRRLIENTKKGDPLRRELTNIYEEFYLGAKRSHRLSKRIEEGIAVLFENYAFDPDYIHENYPNLVNLFIKPTGEYYDKRFTVLLDEIGKIIGDYAELTEEQKLGTRLRFDLPEWDKGFNRRQKLTYELFNRGEPLKRYSKVTDITGETEDPFVHYFNWMNRNTFIANWNIGKNRSVIRADGNWDLIPGTLKDIQKGIKGYEKEFAYYLVGRRVVEDHNRLVELKEKFDVLQEILDEAGGVEEFVNMDPEFKKEYTNVKKDLVKLASIITKNKIPLSQASAVVRLRGEQFKELTDLYDEMFNDLVRFSRNCGLISSTTAEKYIKGEGYAPFFRFINDELAKSNQNIKGTSNFQAKARMYKERTGGEEEIIDPFYNLMTSITEVIDKSLENLIWLNVYKMSLKEPEVAKRFEQIETMSSINPKTGRVEFPQDKDPNLLKIMWGGSRVYVMPAPEFVAVAKNLRGIEWDMFVKLLKIPSSIFTRFTTSMNPVFSLGNITVDQFSQVMQTKTGIKPIINTVESFVDMIKEGYDVMKSAFNKDNIKIDELVKKGRLKKEDVSEFRRYLELGGKRQLFKAQFEVTPEEAVGKITGKTKFEKITGVIESGLNIFEVPSNYSEYASRFAEFRRAKEMGKSDIQAMYMASEVTVPFQLMGNWWGKGGQVWARSMPYFTAGMAVWYKYARTAKEQPGRVFAVNAALITTAFTACIAVMASASDEQKRLLGNLPVRELSRGLFFPHPFNKKKLLRIRIPEQIGSLTGLVYLFIIQHYGGNKVKFKEIIKSLEASIPDQFNILDPAKMVMSWFPQVIAPSSEIIANKKTYPEIAPIVPQYVLDQKEPRYQYTKYTSKLAKEIGLWLNISPMLIDHWIKNQFGAVGRAAFMWQLPYNPLIRQEEGHVMGGRAYQRFYDNKLNLKKEYNSLNKKEKESYSVEEKKELIQDYILHNNMAHILSNWRRALNVTKDMPEELKEDAYQLLLKINNWEKGVDVLDEIEEFNSDLSDFIREKKLDVDPIYKVTRNKIEDSYIDYYRRYGLIPEKKYRR